MRIISVVMGTNSQDERTSDTVSLLNYGKSAYKLNTIIPKDKVLGEIDIELGEQLKGEIVPLEDAVDLVKNNNDDINYTYNIKTNPQVAPVKPGDKIGIVEIYKDKEKIMTVDLTVKNEIKKCSILTTLKRILSLIVLGIR